MSDRPTGLEIRVSTGRGSGPTSLAAFDAALWDAGVANFNLVRLSSVIPSGSIVRSVPPGEQLAGGYGDLLYCVYAEAHATLPGDEAWAGIGWSTRDDGAGLFVEHSARSEATLRHHLHATLAAIGERREGTYKIDGEIMASATCEDRPSCAVVVATYRALGWATPAGLSG